MPQNFMQLVMNPARQRIVQYLLLHGQGTTAEIGKTLQDIPLASLYRHMKTLLEAGCLEVVGENPIRGAVEKTYRLVANPMGEPSQQEVANLFQSGLVSLMATFQEYFATEGCDPQKDGLAFSTSTLMLTDQELMAFLQKLGAVFNEYIGNERAENGRKARRITLISSPGERDEIPQHGKEEQEHVGNQESD